MTECSDLAKLSHVTNTVVDMLFQSAGYDLAMNTSFGKFQVASAPSSYSIDNAFLGSHTYASLQVLAVIPREPDVQLEVMYAS